MLAIRLNVPPKPAAILAGLRWPSTGKRAPSPTDNPHSPQQIAKVIIVFIISHSAGRPSTAPESSITHSADRTVSVSAKANLTRTIAPRPAGRSPSSQSCWLSSDSSG